MRLRASWRWLPPLALGCAGWSTNPVARHLSCSAEANVPTVCTLAGYDTQEYALEYRIETLPEVGLLYETSVNYRSTFTEPVHQENPIGPHELPYVLTDIGHRVVYVPPFNTWPPEHSWASFTYRVANLPPDPALANSTSELGYVSLANPDGCIASSNFDEGSGLAGWSVSGNLPSSGVTGGLRHQPFAWGGLRSYVVGADGSVALDLETGFDQSRWYFEASDPSYFRPDMVSAYGGTVRFTVRALYGNFSELNSPLDWFTLACDACNSGRGNTIVRFVDDFFQWDGSERRVELRIDTSERWMRDPRNLAVPFSDAEECEIAAVLSNLSRVAILGDFTRGGEGVAVDDIGVFAPGPDFAGPVHPVVCQQGCPCKYEPGVRHPTCC